MERYFFGNNSGYGFFNLYEKELKSKDKVVLLKGGSGTGKSSMMKKIAKKAKSLGLDYELWFCSGDPQSLDGVFVKDKKRCGCGRNFSACNRRGYSRCQGCDFRSCVEP